jgi:hypothetical protein
MGTTSNECEVNWALNARFIYVKNTQDTNLGLILQSWALMIRYLMRYGAMELVYLQCKLEWMGTTSRRALAKTKAVLVQH